MYLIAGAMNGEVKASIKMLEGRREIPWARTRFYRGALGGEEMVVCRSGVGKVLTAAILQRALDLFSPRALIFIGLAGSLHPSFSVGDIVVADSCGQWDMDASRFGFKRGETPYAAEDRFIRSDTKLVEAALSFPLQRNRIHSGRLLSGDTFITARGSTEFSFLVKEMGGDAVDMEGYAAASIAAINEIPFVIVKMISDNADGKFSITLAPLLVRASKDLRNLAIHIVKSCAR